MNAKERRILVLLGGMYHDFDRFALMIQPLLKDQNYQVEIISDPDRLLHLHEDQIHIILSYTCLTQHREGQSDSGPEKLSDEQLDALIEWVHSGGGLLGIHSATAIGNSKPELGRLLGGIFISHPPPFTFTVYPLVREHPIVKGIPAFNVFDEFYMQVYEPDIDIHMVATEHLVAYPMVWSKSEGKGRVAYIAMGHYPEIWNMPTYRQLIIQALEWLSQEA